MVNEVELGKKLLQLVFVIEEFVQILLEDAFVFDEMSRPEFGHLGKEVFVFCRLYLLLEVFYFKFLEGLVVSLHVV